MLTQSSHSLRFPVVLVLLLSIIAIVHYRGMGGATETGDNCRTPIPNTSICFVRQGPQFLINFNPGQSDCSIEHPLSSPCRTYDLLLPTTRLSYHVHPRMVLKVCIVAHFLLFFFLSLLSTHLHNTTTHHHGKSPFFCLGLALYHSLSLAALLQQTVSLFHGTNKEMGTTKEMVEQPKRMEMPQDDGNQRKRPYTHTSSHKKLTFALFNPNVAFCRIRSRCRQGHVLHRLPQQRGPPPALRPLQAGHRW